MAEPLKNMYNQAYLDDLAAALTADFPPFDSAGFLGRLFDGRWGERALKERMRHITKSLHPGLPGEYSQALAILRKSAPRLGNYGFENMVFPDYVALYGLDEWAISIPALEQFTQLISAEFAVRPFIVKDQSRMMAQMQRWATHEKASVRRLASEGCRPRLPWGMGLPTLQADPAPILPILELLKDDPAETVRRTVANNINDIAKDHPQTVIALLARWQDEDDPSGGGKTSSEMTWIINHALRTLVKKGDPDALALLGYPRDPAVSVKHLALEPGRVPSGGKLKITFEVQSQSQAEQKLMIDYIVYLMRANGRQTPKVFKLTKRTLAPGEKVTIQKKHSFRPVTTRKYYPGEHAIEIQVNGKRFGRKAFVVAAEQD